MPLLEVNNLKKVYTTRFGGAHVQALSNVSFSVEKGERNGRTYTEVRRLDREQRRQELARLTGGSHVSQTMLDGAEELLAQAEAFRAEL